MAKALDKFIQTMNDVSPYWTKTVELTAKDGEVVVVKHDNFVWHGGNGEKGKE